jgi:hypothetical protein
MPTKAELQERVTELEEELEEIYAKLGHLLAVESEEDDDEVSE